MCKRLKLFYIVTELFSGSQYPTTTIFFPQVCEVKLVLDKWLSCGDIDVELLDSRMSEKFDKYWYDSNGILGIMIVLVPRYKLKLL